MTTALMLGALALETAQIDEADGPGSRSQLWQRPAGVSLQNDGRWHYWLPSRGGDPRHLSHDGAGWHVTASAWSGGHVYHLADTSGRFVSALPLTSGSAYALEPGVEYELRHESGTWHLIVESDTPG